MKEHFVAKTVFNIIISLLVAAVLYVVDTVYAILIMFSNPNAEFYIGILIAFSVLIELVTIAALWRIIKKKYIYIPLIILFVICVGILSVFMIVESNDASIQTVGENNDLLTAYEPYGENTKAVTLDEKADCKITDDYPVMDGATALYPIYASFAKALYPRELLTDNEYLKCTTTTWAYKNIVTGDADIIFAALPSAEQEQYAAENGVELVYTPIGKEAFVFFVNAKNPISDITVSDLQKIYSGEIDEWSSLGIDGMGKIKAFQRDAGSGSQSTMEKFMGDIPLADAPKADVIGDMGGIIEKTADYKNYKNAIGYSFRFYSTEMVKNNQIKLLSINGVYPSVENIKNGTYPLASYFYAVTRKDASANTLRILEWLRGEQAQKIIEMTGYTPLSN